MFLPNARIVCNSEEEAKNLGDFLESECVLWQGGGTVNAESLVKKQHLYGNVYFSLFDRTISFSWINIDDDNLTYCRCFHIQSRHFNISVDKFLDEFCGNSPDEVEIDMSSFCGLL